MPTKILRSAQILDGKALAQELMDGLKAKIQNSKLKPGLAVILVGDNAASKVYVNSKEKSCIAIGIDFKKHIFTEDTPEEKLIKHIKNLNKDPKVHGIIVQMPLPKGVNSKRIIKEIDPKKDVDGFHPINLGKILTGEKGFKPASARAVLKLLEETKVELKGAEVCLVGWGNAGKPLSLMLLKKDCSLSICNEFTKDIKKHTKKADILISATGVPELITASMVKRKAIVIDVGTTKVGDSLMGDIVFDKVKKKASWITPVPGGVGPMTVAMLLGNVVKAAKRLS